MGKKILFLSGAMIFVALVIVVTLWVKPFDSHHTEQKIIYAFQSKDHAACVASAIEWEPGKKLALCEKNDSGVSGYSDAFFYDSADEIVHPNKSLSPEWRKTAKTFFPEFGGDGDVISVTPLGGHFYFVKVDVGPVEGAHFF